MKKLKISPVDEINHVAQTGEINAYAFMNFKLKSDHKGFKELYVGTRELIKKLDKEMTELCLAFGDDGALVNWAARMKVIQTNIDNIDRNLPHEGTRLFDWESVISSVGFLVAIRVGVEQTIELNKRPVLAKSSR